MPITDSLAARLGEFAAATLYEALGKTGGMTPDIRPMIPGARMAGIAYTVRILGSATAAVLTAVAEAPPGAVLVIDTGSVGQATTWGGTSGLAAKVRGLAGMVTNGLVRDIDEMIELGLPVFAAGVSVIGTLKNHPGWRGIPIAIGGVVVHPGDFVIGDSDGVAVVPAARAGETISAARGQRAREAERDGRIRAGESIIDVLGLGTKGGH